MIDRLLPERLTGAILAGGKGRRMGGSDKGLVECGGRPLIAYVIEAMEPVCTRLYLNANRSLAEYRHFGHPVISDSLAGFHGPLAGILSVMEVATTDLLVVAPCDCPRLQSETLARLVQALDKDIDIAVAHDGVRLHPVVMALRTRLAGDLGEWLKAGRHKIDRWVERHPWLAVDMSDVSGQFVNINTPEELQTFERERLAS